jgi:hypothetical protein
VPISLPVSTVERSANSVFLPNERVYERQGNLGTRIREAFQAFYNFPWETGRQNTFLVGDTYRRLMKKIIGLLFFKSSSRQVYVLSNSIITGHYQTCL